MIIDDDRRRAARRRNRARGNRSRRSGLRRRGAHRRHQRHVGALFRSWRRGLGRRCKASGRIKPSRGIGGRMGGAQISSIGLAVFIICLAVGLGPSVYYNNPTPMVIGTLIGLYFLFAIKVAEQWQKAAVLRLGRYIGLRGPGMFFIIPVIDSISQYVDQRVRVTDVKAESALTHPNGRKSPAGAHHHSGCGRSA